MEPSGNRQNGSSAISPPRGGRLSGEAGVRASIADSFPAGQRVKTSLAWQVVGQAHAQVAWAYFVAAEVALPGSGGTYIHTARCTHRRADSEVRGILLDAHVAAQL